MLSLFSPILLPIGYDSELLLSRWPSFSLANLTNKDGIVKGSNRNLTGLRNDDSSRFPSLNEAEPLTLESSLCNVRFVISRWSKDNMSLFVYLILFSSASMEGV